MKRFLLYCFYAFGIPIVVTITCFVLDTTQLLSEPLRFSMGVHRCWIQETFLAEAIYIYIPIMIIVATNIFFYVSTACKIRKVRRETSVIRECGNITHSRADLENARY
jgi:G protein-coupled receptor Mth (Methuselah protein)